MNPFKYGSTVSAENFCPRPELETDISKHVTAMQNIHIEGDRRTAHIKRLKDNRIIHSSGKKLVFASLFLKLWLVRNPHF